MKSPFFVVNSRPYCHCRSFVEKSCLLSRIYFMRCRYFLGNVACRNLPWQGLDNLFDLLKFAWERKHDICKLNEKHIFALPDLFQQFRFKIFSEANGKV